MSPDSQSPFRVTLATKVTLLRFLGIPFFVLMMIYYCLSLREGAPEEWYRRAGLAIFLLVALTDALDGWLARSRGEITLLGRILDPLADKTLLLSAVIVLTRPGLPELSPQLPVWFALAIISRDVLLVLGTFVVHFMTHHVDVRPRWTGKVATVLQMTSVLWVLADGAVRPFDWIAATAVLFTLVSGAQYALDGIRQIERAHHHPAPPRPPPAGGGGVTT